MEDILGSMGPLVTTEWLAGHIGEYDVVVLDATLPPVGVAPVVDVRARYLEAHIPGAMFFDIEALSDPATTLPHMLPTARSFAESMAAMGVGDGSTIVVYEQEGVFSAPRAWWMLRTFGARDVYVLDGGLRAWVDEELPTEAFEVRSERAVFTASYDAAAVRSLAEMKELLRGKGQIVDARSAGRFAGMAPEPRAGLRSGHMPGAVSVPFGELVNAGRMRGSAEIRELFEAKGVDLERPVTTTCGSGVTAAVLALGLAMCEATEVSVYDGSWTEYAQRPGAEIVTGA